MDKREVSEMKAKIMAALDSKVDLQEVQSVMNNTQTESSGRIFEIRQELFSKLSEVQSYISQNLSKKVNAEDFNEALAYKMDIQTARTQLESKANAAELDHVRRLVEKTLRDSESKVSFKELEMQQQRVKD